jgi:hypothetical protein
MSSSEHHRQSKRAKCLCAACQERKARFKYRGEVRADRDHTLCFACYRAAVNRARARRMSHRAQINMGEHLDATDRYMRLALKAQSQCRATLETLAAIKNPPTVFARQANIAQGPQQVNNTVSLIGGDAQPLARAGNQESEPNKLLEAHGERLDLGATSTAGAGDQALAAVGARHRPANG